MKAKDAAKLLNTFADIYPDVDITFANNKVPVNIVQYDAKSNSINIR